MLSLSLPLDLPTRIRQAGNKSSMVIGPTGSKVLRQILELDVIEPALCSDHASENFDLPTPRRCVVRDPRKLRRCHPSATGILDQTHPAIAFLALRNVLADVLPHIAPDALSGAFHRKKLSPTETVFLRGQPPEHPLAAKLCRRTPIIPPAERLEVNTRSCIERQREQNVMVKTTAPLTLQHAHESGITRPQHMSRQRVEPTLRFPR